LERLRQRLSVAGHLWTVLEELRLLPTNRSTQPIFEQTFETVWKAAQLYLSTVESLECSSPKSVIRACRQVGLLDDEQTSLALQMADDRTVHTYNEDLAGEINYRILMYTPLMGRWIKAMRKRVPMD
jgi:hypothetical protein